VGYYNVNVSIQPNSLYSEDIQIKNLKFLKEIYDGVKDNIKIVSPEQFNKLDVKSDINNCLVNLLQDYCTMHGKRPSNIHLRRCDVLAIINQPWNYFPYSIKTCEEFQEHFKEMF